MFKYLMLIWVYYVKMFLNDGDEIKTKSLCKYEHEMYFMQNIIQLSLYLCMTHVSYMKYVDFYRGRCICVYILLIKDYCTSHSASAVLLLDQ